jgi:hypothetical protein
VKSRSLFQSFSTVWIRSSPFISVSMMAAPIPYF